MMGGAAGGAKEEDDEVIVVTETLVGLSSSIMVSSVGVSSTGSHQRRKLKFLLQEKSVPLVSNVNSSPALYSGMPLPHVLFYLFPYYM